jgi:hypothetical protein
MKLSDKIIENFKQMFTSAPLAPLAEVAQLASVAPVPEVAQLASVAPLAPTLLETAFANLQSLGLITEKEIPLELEAKTTLVIEAFEQTLSKLNEAEKQISLLNAKLSAKPTIPTNVTDPQVSVNLSNPDKDETGKQILANIPQDLRYKLRKPQPINS